MKPLRPNLLIFEDDQYITATISWKLNVLGNIHIGTTHEACVQLLQNTTLPALAIIDLHLGKELYAGKKLLALCKSKNIPTIAISSDENEQLVTELYELGATHFLIKKDYLELLFQYAQSMLKSSESNYFEKIFNQQFFTKNSKLKKDIKQLWSIPLKGQNLHISGPTGSGKTLLANLYHQELYGKSPFVHLNCAEIPEALMESELFGHQKGSFTGADKDYKGKISLANNGTLFLDEIGCLSLSLQAKLLKVIESQSFYPVGSNEEKKVNFTLITATWEDLFEKTKNNQFRLDLLQRIMNYRLSLPGLMDRSEDIDFFIEQWMKKYPRKFSIANDAQELLRSYSYPGNFRELKAILMQLAQSPKGVVDKGALLQILSLNAPFKCNPILSNSDEIIKIGIKKYLQNLEKKIVSDFYLKHDQQVTPVLKDLKLSASSFYRITHSEE